MVHKTTARPEVGPDPAHRTMAPAGSGGVLSIDLQLNLVMSMVAALVRF